jgi:uncharacterized membrane protein YsdA (DUF1294 family)/cold shock CspA family protein
MRYQGRITTWKDDKGFGFITPNNGGEQVFVHISSLSNRQARPKGNELVTYELAIDGNGRSQAKAVALAGGYRATHKPLGRGNVAPLFAILFLLFVLASVISGRLPLAVLGLYLAASVVTFVAYAMDKSAAKQNQWRTQESTLHILALLGGWPGALAAQRFLRHKSVKGSFQAVFWTTVLLNCAVLGWLLSPSGAQILQSVLGVV